MCSSTLTQLIKLRDACAARGGALVISDSSRCAARLIEVTGLASYLGLESAMEPAR
jgi:anti-anti-sigma regulatory factor